MENPSKQTPATLNQIEVTEPNVPRSFNKMEGDIAGTFNAGHYRTIAIKEVMAGERIAVEGAKLFIQLATPRTPAYQRLIAKVTAYKVPHVRVFKNYYEFKAQNGGTSTAKIKTLPNFQDKKFPIVSVLEDNVEKAYSIQETTAWRDSFASCYIPRVGAGIGFDALNNDTIPFIQAPPINALAIRGWVAIWNDKIRNKQYEEARTEYTGNTVSTQEWNSYMWDGMRDKDFYQARCRRNNSYYMNYRTELQGYQIVANEEIYPEDFALNWASFESKFNELRKQAEHAEMNPWDVAQKLSGGKKLTEGRVEVIGERTFPINYSAITQNAYNNNGEIEEKYRVMGMQGGYSYTEIDIGFINGFEAIEDGYIHFVINITADTVFESAVDRQLMDNNWDERYRPDLKDDKLDVIYEAEFGTPWAEENVLARRYDSTIGFKRKYNEWFKLINCLNGEIYNRGYFQLNPNGEVESSQRILPNNTYQFFEFSGSKFQEVGTLEPVDKKIWLDYTDVAVNKNLAIRQLQYSDESGHLLKGPNQIMYFGKHYCLSDMPIDEAIKNNFTKYGEH